MSVLDSFFNKGFKGAKCKTLLKLTIPRIKLLRNRREIQIKQMRRDIAKLLETGQEATARIRVEHIIREEKMMAAQEIIELFCELIAVRLPIIETQRECPLDLKEAISSVCFATPRCSDLPELQQVQILFSSKYGKEFVSAATELVPDCGVNRQLIELLSIRAPPAETKLKLLKEIAEEHELDWDPGASETELFKSHEDLLNGPNQFISGSKVPIPEKNHDESLYSAPVEASNEQSDSDSGLDSLDLPEVPKVSLRPSSETESASELVPPPYPAPPDSELCDLPTHSFGANKNISVETYLEPEADMPEQPVASHYGSSNNSVSKREEKQFLPFIAPPTLSSASFPARLSEPVPSLARTKSALTATQVTTDTADEQHEAAPAAHSFPLRQSEPIPSLARTKSEVNVDLQDVLAAAQTAADSAERAAAAARSAASLAQVRITELIKKRTDRASKNDDHPCHDDSPDQSSTSEMPQIDHQKSFGDTNGSSYSVDPNQSHSSKQGSNPPSFDTPSVGYESLLPSDQLHDKTTHHQPQRLPSMEDDPYFAYPNLFTSQDSNLGSGSADNSRSTHEL